MPRRRGCERASPGPFRPRPARRTTRRPQPARRAPARRTARVRPRRPSAVAIGRPDRAGRNGLRSRLGAAEKNRQQERPPAEMACGRRNHPRFFRLRCGSVSMDLPPRRQVDPPPERPTDPVRRCGSPRACGSLVSKPLPSLARVPFDGGTRFSTQFFGIIIRRRRAPCQAAPRSAAPVGGTPVALRARSARASRTGAAEQRRLWRRFRDTSAHPAG